MTHSEFRRLALARGLLPQVPRTEEPEEARPPADGNAPRPAAAEAG